MDHTRMWPYWLFIVISLTCITLSHAATYDTATIRDLTYRSGDVSLPIELFLPLSAPGQRAVVLLIPEASEPQSTGRAALRPWGEWLAAQGYVAVLPAYRLPPDCRYPAQLADLRAAHQWIVSNAVQYRCDARRIVLLGVSLGGLFAAQYALTAAPHPSPIVGVATYSSPMDLRVPPPTLVGKIALQMLLGATRDEEPARYAHASPITHITRENTPPFLLAHRTRDTLVPYTQASEMAHALMATGVSATLEALPGDDHALPDFSSPAGKQLSNALGVFLAQRFAH